MAAKDWQAAAEAYAVKELELFPELAPDVQTAMVRVVVQAYKAGALAGFDRADEIRKEMYPA